jgi:hypothetical protein
MCIFFVQVSALQLIKCPTSFISDVPIFQRLERLLYVLLGLVFACWLNEILAKPVADADEANAAQVLCMRSAYSRNLV